MKVPENFLNNAYIENGKHSSPNIHIIFEDFHRVNACDIQKTYTKMMQRTVQIGLSEGYKVYKKQYSSNTYVDTTMEAGTRLVDRMMEKNMKSWEEVIRSTDLTH